MLSWEPVQRLHARIQAYGTGDHFSILDPTVLADAQAISVAVQTGDIDPRQEPEALIAMLGWFHWNRHEAMGSAADPADLVSALAHFDMIVAVSAAAVPIEARRKLAEQRMSENQCARLHGCRSVVGHMLDRDDDEMFRAALSLLSMSAIETPRFHPDSAAVHHWLSIAWQLNFVRRWLQDDLDGAEEMATVALSIAKALLGLTPDLLLNSGRIHYLRYGLTGDPSALNQALQAFSAVVPDPPDRTLAMFGRPTYRGRSVERLAQAVNVAGERLSEPLRLLGMQRYVNAAMLAVEALVPADAETA